MNILNGFNCIYLEKGYGLGVETPVMSPRHRPFVGEVYQPTLFDDFRADSLGLLDALYQSLDWNVGHVGSHVRVESSRSHHWNCGFVVRRINASIVLVITVISVGDLVVFTAVPLLLQQTILGKISENLVGFLSFTSSFTKKISGLTMTRN